jgi:hypothetical protein
MNNVRCVNSTLCGGDICKKREGEGQSDRRLKEINNEGLHSVLNVIKHYLGEQIQEMS